MKKFYGFAAVWLAAVATFTVVAAASGYDWSRVTRWTVSVGLMPLFTAYCVMVVGQWLRQQPRD